MCACVLVCVVCLILFLSCVMTDFTESATLPKYTKSRNSDSSVQIQTEPTCQFEFVRRYTEKSGFLDLIDVGDVAFSVETVIESAQGKELARGDTAPAGAREKSQEK